MWQKRVKRGTYRNIGNLCPNCFSTLIKEDVGSNYVCSGDKLTEWHKNIEDYKKMGVEEQKVYLSTLGNSSKFLELVQSSDSLDCGYNNRYSGITPNYITRIPDPMAVNRLEKQLKRKLTEEELEEGHGFSLEGTIYTLPFLTFPEEG